MGVMETVIKVEPNEFNHALVDKIRSFINGSKNFEITITIKEKALHEYLFEEPQATYETRLNKSIDDIENNRDLVSFTVEEFEKFAASLPRK